MTPGFQLALCILSAILIFVGSMIAVYLQRISENMKELSEKLNVITNEFAASKEKITGITTGCNARHIYIDDQLKDHDDKIRDIELTLAKIN